MKRSLLLTVLLVSLLGLQGNAYAQIFSAVSPSGHTLYYKVINPSSRWVELSNPNNTDGIWTDAWDNYSAPYGNVVVPQTVTFNNITWTVRRIGRSAFASCPSVKRVSLPEGIDSIKAYAFFGTEIDSVNIPSSVVYIGSSNFQSSRLHHVSLPVGLLYIDPWEQCGDSILDFTIPDGNPYYRTIDGCLIRTENGFSNLVSFPKGRINGTMEIPEGVNRISWEIMDYVYSTNTHRLVLPSTITRIGLNWFGFNQVDTIVCRSVTPPQLLFDGVDQQYIRPIRLEVPCGSQLLYNSSIWVLIAGSYGTVTSYLPLGNQSQTIEYGESYPWGNRVLTERGVYEDTVQSVLEGCDSMHRVLTLNVVRRSSVDVTIAEGGNYRGHTLAGVYEDTIPTANYDSIVRSRISMNVNRPLDNCMVQLGGNMASYYYNGMVIGGNGASIEVPPAESRQVFMNKALTFDFDFVSNGENLIPNGDFEQGNTGFTTEYSYDATTSNAASSYGIYNVRQDFGVNGSYGMGFDASQNPILLYGTTVPNIGGCVYRLTFMARTENTPPHFVVKVNGVQIDDIDYGPENQDWNTYEHYFYADGSNIDLQIFNVNLATESGVDFYMDNISLEYMPVDPNDIDTITITNTHGMVRNTVDVTINEGGSYRGHTLAGVYQDTIIGANTDSIVRSRVSMSVNRPMNNCTVQLGGNVSGYCYTDGMDHPGRVSESLSTQVAPMETKQVLYGLVPGVNLLENGDFEQGNTGFSNDYEYVECGQPFCGYAWYNIMQGYGVDGSYGMAVDGAGSDHDLLRYEITLPNNANSTYKFSYMVMNSRYWNDENPPYIAIKVNGVQVGDTDYVPLEETWVTYEHTFTTDGGNIVIQLQDLNSDSYGNNFYVDNVRLESISVDAADIDTITVTNTHGMVYDTVDVTIAEGGSYRSHTLAGVYQDTIIGTNADSIVRSRISMNVNRPMNNCTVQLGGNVSGTYVNGEEYYCTGTNAQVQVLPAESSQLLFTTAMFGVNLIENGDFEQSDSYPYPGDYITADWDGSPYRTYSVRGDDGIGGNRCLYLDGSTQSNQAFFRHTITTREGDLYRFSYKARNWCSGDLPLLVFKVNGQQVDGNDIVPNDCYTWTTFSHNFVATGGTTTIEIVDLNTMDGGNDWIVDDISLVCLTLDATDTITITNTHGMVIDTVDVTINEGGSYRSHTLAGVYCDSILGAATDSIVYARVSMNINHTFGEGYTTLSSNQEGHRWIGLDDDIASHNATAQVMVNPAESHRYLFAMIADNSNLLPNGDFEQGYVYFNSEYPVSESSIPFLNSYYYTICDTCGRTGKGMAVKGAREGRKNVYDSQYVPIVAGHTYSLNYWANSHENNPAILDFEYYNSATGEWTHLTDTNYLSEAVNQWKHFEVVFSPTMNGDMFFRIRNINYSDDGNEFFLDDISLVDLTVDTTASSDTIRVTNVHGMVYSTVDVTITEGGSYRSHTLAGVYQDTIIGANADSIIRSRISMNVNRTMNNCTVQLGGNQGGTYFTENEYYPAGTEISVEPAESKTIQYTPDVLGENLLAISDMEGEDATYISLYAGDYAANPGGVGTEEIYGWGGRGANGSTGLFFIGSTDTTKAFFRTSLSSNAGDRFSFRFMVTATGNNMDPNHRAILALKVNGELMYPIDSLGNCIEPTWGAFEHIIEATSDITTIELVNLHAFTGEGGDNQWFMDNFSLTKLFSTNSEAITITNTHGMVYDTVDVTIAEGDSYRGYTLAGVYQDTIIGANTDSIVRSRVSMTVNRPMDNCMVQLGGNLWGSYAVAGGESVQVLPGECVQVMFVKYDSPDVEFVGNGDNLIVNGDFEQGNTGFTTEYGYGSGCGGAGCGYGIYTIQQGYGVDGSIGMSADASENPILLWGTTVPTVPGNIYKFTFMARTENMPPPYFAVKVNGEQIGDIEYAPEDYNWHTFERLFFATSSSIDLQLYNLNPETGSGVDFYMDNFRLESMTTNDDNINTITITNTHGMVIDTVDVTIAEGGSYRSHTLAGVYCDTIIGAATDSIMYARVSMDINYTFGTGTASVTTNQDDRLWMGLDDEVLTTEPGFTVQLQPQEERRYVLTFIADASNLQPNSDFESYSSNWSSDYAWSEIPFQGSHYINVCDTCGRSGNGLAVKGSELQNRFFYTGEWANLVEGHLYSFSYWAKSRTADNPAMLSVYVNDQQTEWMLPDTDNLNEAIGQWKHYEHTFTARRTYTSLMRIMDLNTSNIGNEFFLDDVSLIDLTEAEDAHRDTITLHNTHGLHIATVNVTINEGESHIGHTLAGVYNDTLVMADYDSITHSRVSYIMNVSGAGFSSLENNVDGIWVDIDNNAFVEGDSIGVYSMESRHFGLLAPVSDTNLIANGDFEQGNTGFTSYFLHRPEPYDLGDGTYYIGGYRINEMDGNHYIYAFNYWEPRNGPLYVTTATVEPNTWYMISYRGVSNMLRGDVTVHPYGNDNTVKINNQLIGLDTLTYSGSMDMTQAETFTHYFYNNSETTVSIEINTNFGETYDFAYDDITLTPLTIIDTVTITNRHQLVYNTVDITLNEGESYNGHTLAGVYNDTTFFADYDSITRSRISMVINSLDGYVQLSSNQHGWWINLNTDTVLLSSHIITNVPPMQSHQYMLDRQAATGNLLVNGDFEQGNTGFTSQYNYSDGCFGCGPGNYFVSSDHGVDNSGCLSVDGAEEYGKIAYEQAVTAVAGRIYRFRYMATTNGTDNSNPSWFEVLVNGTAIGNWDHISTNYPNWTSFEHVFIAPSNSLTIQIIDRNLEYNGNDFLLDNLELVIVGDDSTLLDTITITNIHQLVYDTVSANICQGETFTYDNTGFIETGTYGLPMLHSTDTTMYRTVVLDVHDIYYMPLQVDLCEGDSYMFGNDNLMQAGMYMDSLSSVWGCDSIVALDLTVHYVYNETTIDTACNSHYWNGEWRTVSGDYLYNHYAANGCPQVDTLHLTVNYSNSSYNEVEACDSMTWNGVTYTASEVVDYQTTNAAGCDSVATLNLTVKYSTTSESEAVACDSYTWNGVTYNASDELVYQSTNVVGCDSTATLYLTVNHSYQHTDTVNTCDNMLPFIYNEQPFSVAGNYTVELQSVEGCDSTIALTLNIDSTYSHTDELTICQSAMPYNYGPRTFVQEDTTGIYSIPFSTVDGCDSIISLDLTVHESEVTEIYVVTVQGTNNLVLWHKDAAVDHYNIYRESSTSGVYSLVAEVPYSDEPEWLDTESDARAHSYRYRMTSVDSCGTESDHGIIHKTMHLTINKGQNNSWNLVWTEYEGTNYSTYLIYRGHSYNSLQMIGEIPSNNTTFTDNNAPNGNVYYQIVVLLSPDGTKDGNDGTIRSNVATNETEGIYDGIEVGANIYTVDGDIVVETMMGENLRVMDVSGRVLYKSISTGSDLFTMPSSGVYFVQVGTNQARRVVVVK